MTNTISPWPQDDAEKTAFKDWQYEVASGDTAVGFRDWLQSRREDDLTEDRERLFGEYAGQFRDGYDDEAINRLNAQLLTVETACVWEYIDTLGFGGDSEIVMRPRDTDDNEWYSLSAALWTTLSEPIENTTHLDASCAPLWDENAAHPRHLGPPLRRRRELRPRRPDERAVPVLRTATNRRTTERAGTRLLRLVRRRSGSQRHLHRVTVPLRDKETPMTHVTLIPVMYRDGDNYKATTTFVTDGPITREQKARLAQTLDDGVWFIPTQIGLPHLGPALESFPSDADHIWHEMLLDDGEFEVITRKDFAGRCVNTVEVGPVDQFVARMEVARRDGWDDSVSAADVA